LATGTLGDEKISCALDLNTLYEFLTNIVWQRGQVLNSIYEIGKTRNLLFSCEQHAAIHVILGILPRGGGGGGGKNRRALSGRRPEARGGGRAGRGGAGGGGGNENMGSIFQTS